MLLAVFLGLAAAYREQLTLVPVSRSKALAMFEFGFEAGIGDGLYRETGYFPGSVLQTLEHAGHWKLTFTQGGSRQDLKGVLRQVSQDRESDWEYRASGVSMQTNLEADWTKLSYQLGGLFCSDLPVQGQPVALNDRLYSHFNDFFCKENIVATLKMLPCRNQLGLGKLMDVKLHESSYLSLRHEARRVEQTLTYSVKLIVLVPATTPFKIAPEPHCIDTRVFLSDASVLSPVVDLRKVVVEGEASIQNYLVSSRELRGPPYSFAATYVHTLTNTHFTSLSVTLYEILPRPVFPWLHTLKHPGRFTVKKLEEGWLLTFTFTVEASSQAIIQFDIEKQFLQFEQYPTDPYRGWDLPSTPLHFSNNNGLSGELYTDRLVVMVREPDFAMPFNVMCITGAVIAFLVTTFQTFILSKPREHWSSKYYETVVKRGEWIQKWFKRLFLCFTIGLLAVLDHYGVIKVFG